MHHKFIFNGSRLKEPHKGKKRKKKKGFSLLHLIMHSILNIVLNRSLVRNPLMVRNKKTRGAWSLAERR